MGIIGLFKDPEHKLAKIGFWMNTVTLSVLVVTAVVAMGVALYRDLSIIQLERRDSQSAILNTVQQ